MLASSSKLFISIVYLFIATSSLVQSHELSFNRRDHGPKRFFKNRSIPDLPPFASVLPSVTSGSQIATSIVSQSTESATTTSSLASTSAISISTSSSIASTSGTTSSQSTSSIISSSTSTSSSSTVINPSTPTSTPEISPSIDSTPVTVALTAHVVASTITSTQSLSANPSDTAIPQVQSASSKTKTTTVTVLIAVAASVGGIAILWTIFRKWKLSSSKEFDRRLNPITDWQPTHDEDDVPGLRRAPSSSSSFHSGGGSANGHSAGITPLDHDFTAGPGNSAPIGGYADLARATSPNPPMQQTLERGPSFNHGYGVPLHHQTGYGTYNAYDYNGGGARY